MMVTGRVSSRLHGVGERSRRASRDGMHWIKNVLSIDEFFTSKMTVTDFGRSLSGIILQEYLPTLVALSST